MARIKDRSDPDGRAASRRYAPARFATGMPPQRACHQVRQTQLVFHIEGAPARRKIVRMEKIRIPHRAFMRAAVRIQLVPPERTLSLKRDSDEVPAVNPVTDPHFGRGLKIRREPRGLSADSKTVLDPGSRRPSFARSLRTGTHRHQQQRQHA